MTRADLLPPVTLPLPPRPSLGPKEQGMRLRRAVHWATDTSPHWADALDGLRLSLVTPSLASARLEGATPTGGSVMLRIEGTRLHFIRIELGWSLTLDAALPDRLT